MKLMFVDATGLGYDVSTPLDHPLGGSQSAACYLSAELARRAHRVILATSVAEDRELTGVSCLSMNRLTSDVVGQPWDALVVLNGPADLCFRIRPHVNPATPLVLWTQHSHHQPMMAAIASPEVRSAWDMMVFVSDWQRLMFIRQFGVDPARTCVLRNAIAPAFERMFGAPEELAQAKPSRPVLAYTSTPYRGLQVLLEVFPTLRGEYPEAELQVFSSMRVYLQGEHEGEYAALYEKCRSTPGIRYLGSVPQNRLAEALRGVSILSYPNVFLETSCIAVMEALAAGAQVVTSDLAALPETSMGFATLVPVAELRPGERFASFYSRHLKAVLEQHRTDPAAFAAARWEQVREINASCTWRQRASQWEDAIALWRQGRR